MAALPQAPTATGPTRSISPPDLRHQVVIVGDGSAGISVAARLHRRWREVDAVIEPSEQHSYQPLWTLVGAGKVAKERTVRPEGSVIPNGVTWIREAVVGFES
jgi:sulfide:quinone oxidoreductase